MTIHVQQPFFCITPLVPPCHRCRRPLSSASPFVILFSSSSAFPQCVQSTLITTDTSAPSPVPPNLPHPILVIHGWYTCRSARSQLPIIILQLLLPCLITSDNEGASAFFLGIELPFYTQLLLPPARIHVVRPLDISSNLPTDLSELICILLDLCMVCT
ncbi:hypothetical protein EV360DRAFT_90080 [Lentinula raphanica]|nr:hypothetical protein EV360DRAFT_90080 [Lentinula raphanica]